MFDLVEIELTRVRKMVEHADDHLLTEEPHTLQRCRRGQNFPRKTTVPRPHALTTPQPS